MNDEAIAEKIDAAEAKKNVSNIDKSPQGREILKIMYTNCRSVVNKIDELRTISYDIKPDMILSSLRLRLDLTGNGRGS